MKRIFHVGAWNRNYGDYVLQRGIVHSLQSATDHGLEFVPVDCQKTYFHDALIDYINRTGDLLLVGGGGLIFNRPEDNSVSGWQFNIPIEGLERLRAPLVVYAIGYNRFPYDRSDFKAGMNEHLAATLESAALFSVRNKGTYEQLVSRGLDGEKIEIVPDSGMFAPASDAISAECFGPGPVIGVNWAGDRPEHRYPEPSEKIERSLAEALALALKSYLADRGSGRIVLIPHLREVDSRLAPVFRDVLGNSFVDLSEAMPYLYPPSYAQADLLVGLYRQLDLVIGMRGHATIIPFGTGTPFISIGTHNKNRFFVTDIGLGNNHVGFSDYPDGCSPADFRRALDRLDGASLARSMAAAHRDQRAIAERFNARILDLLN